VLYFLPFQSNIPAPLAFALLKASVKLLPVGLLTTLVECLTILCASVCCGFALFLGVITVSGAVLLGVGLALSTIYFEFLNNGIYAVLYPY
jgi:hypothetical protein